MAVFPPMVLAPRPLPPRADFIALRVLDKEREQNILDDPALPLVHIVAPFRFHHHTAPTGSSPSGGHAGLSLSAQRSPPSTATAARAAICAAHAALDDPCPGNRIAAGAGSEPGGLGSREGSGAGGSTTLGSLRGSCMPAAWGRVMRTGVNVSYGPRFSRITTSDFLAHAAPLGPVAENAGLTKPPSPLWSSASAVGPRERKCL